MDSTQPSSEPTISVVMPVYNGAFYVEKAVRSMLDQSYRDLEVVIVDDGSTDDSPKILDRIAQADDRVRILRRANAGIVAALNDGLAAARGEFIARMDADDISLPDRLELQMQFMQQHPDCVAVGTAMVNIDPDGDPIAVQQFPLDHETIDRHLLRGIGGIAHPSSLIRASAIHEIGGYRFRYQWVEDKDLWLRLAEVGRLANLPDVLLQYRLHLESVCHRRSREQSRLMRRLLVEVYKRRSQEIPARSGECQTSSESTDEREEPSQSPVPVEEESSPPRQKESIKDDPHAQAPAYRSTADVHIHWSNWALSAGNFQTALKHAWSAVRARPVSFDVWPLLLRALLRIQNQTGMLRGVRRMLVQSSAADSKTTDSKTTDSSRPDSDAEDR